MWDLPGPGLEPVSPALAGGFLTTAPPGKPPSVLKIFFLWLLDVVGKILKMPLPLDSSHLTIQSNNNLGIVVKGSHRCNQSLKSVDLKI